MTRTCPTCNGTNIGCQFNGATYDEDNTRCIDVGCYCRDCGCLWYALEYPGGKSEVYEVIQQGRDV